MDRPAGHFFEFDAFRVDVAERLLLRDGNAVPLTPKVFDILLLLVENCGRTVGKHELLDRVWADSFVEEGNLNRNVSTLRKVLDDDPLRPRFIKTAPKRGYCFVGEVHEVWEDDEAILVENRTRYHLLVREEKEKGSFVSPIRLAAAGIFAVLAITFAWVWSQTQKNEASSWVAPGHQPNAEAYEVYRQGRALWQSRSGEDLHQSTMLLEQAVRIDPNFAIARAALADAYAFDYTNWKKAEAEARRAMDLDQSIGEPHASIGFVKTFWEWKLREAEDEFRHAIRLSPEYATAHQWYAVLLMATDRRDGAYAEISRALELDPNSISVNADMCQMLYFLRRYDDAIAQCKKTIELEPTFFNAHAYLYEVYSLKGIYSDSLKIYFGAEQLRGLRSRAESYGDLQRAADSGDIRAFWQARFDELKTAAPAHAAKYAVRLGRNEQAIKLLQEAYAKRDPEFLLFYADPVFDPVRGDHRFEALIGLLYPAEN